MIRTADSFSCSADGAAGSLRSYGTAARAYACSPAAGAWPLHLAVYIAGAVAITAAQFGYLLEGIDWRMPQHTWRPQAAG